jgi:O-antigen/teichoic acid export membrane protein
VTGPEITLPSARGAFLRRLGGFIGIPVIAAAAAVLVLPFLSRAAGTEGWAELASAQAIGTFGGVLVFFGWGVYGPPRIAITPDPAERRRLYLLSLRVRSIAFVACTVVLGLIVAAIARPEHRVDAILMMAAMTAGGLSPSWYCIGAGDPRALAVYDSIPKLVAAVVSVPILITTGWVASYPILTLVASIGGAAVFSLTRFRRVRRAPAASGETRWTATVHAAAIDAAGNAYGATPLPIATASLDAAEAAGFASADRFYRAGLGLVVVSFGNAFQGWVLAGPRPSQLRRQLVAIATHTVLGLIGLVVLAVLGPWATGLFFGEPVAADPTVSALYGVAFLFISASTPLIRNVLIPVGRATTVFVVTVVTAVAGLAVMIAGALTGSAAVIALGIAASELILAVALAIPAARILRGLSRTAAADPDPST